MCSRVCGDSNNRIYTFRVFRYEKIRPKIESKVPLPRSGHRIGADSANFYSFGGYNPSVRTEDNDQDLTLSYPLFKELWKFNFAKKEWYRYPNKQSMPSELASNALILHKNILMVYGGTGSPFGYRCSNQLFIGRMNDNKGPMIEIKTTGQLPLALYGQAIIFYNDYLYTIGGTSGLSYTCDIHRLNLKTVTWEIVYICNGVGEYEPKGRYRHEVGFDTKNIYILGGGTAEEVYDFYDVPVFNLEKKHWYAQRTIRDNKMGIPSSRRCHGSVQINNNNNIQVFISGGLGDENVYDDLWRLDLKTFQWTYFETCHLPYPTYFHASAVTPEGKMFIFGGIKNIPNYIVARDNKIYSTWLCIPKLSEICWEALLFYCPNLANCKYNDLINIGLPRHFIQRLGQN